VALLGLAGQVRADNGAEKEASAGFLPETPEPTASPWAAEAVEADRTDATARAAATDAHRSMPGMEATEMEDVGNSMTRRAFGIAETVRMDWVDLTVAPVAGAEVEAKHRSSVPATGAPAAEAEPAAAAVNMAKAAKGADPLLLSFSSVQPA